MTTRVVTDEQYGKIYKRAHELIFRVSKGAVEFEHAYSGLQVLIEGNKVCPIEKKQNWLQSILARERQCHLSFFDKEFNLSEFRETLQKYGASKIRAWANLGLEPHFLPKVSMDLNLLYPGWKVKPQEWYYAKMREGAILRNINGSLFADKEMYLEGITVLVDTRLKPSYNSGKQMYLDDNLLGPIIENLRFQCKIAKNEYGPQSSRFGVSANEWEDQIKPSLAKKLGLDSRQVRLERAIEANIIPQLYSHMPRVDDGITNTWVWYEEFFEGRGSRLSGGGSAFGGLAVVCDSSSDLLWSRRAFRSLAVL